jgi:hypothetical protein
LDNLSINLYKAFCSSITGTLATHAVLKGVGVGDEKASAVAATVTWLLRDGTGMVGRIVFAWLKGSSLDYDAKKWRLFADVLNDMAICLDLLASLFPSYFMVIICISSVSKSIVGVAGGSTRAALTQHQAKRNNMADVSAKDGNQETLVNLTALLVGLIITPLVAGNLLLTWMLFVCFTCLHLFANYKAVTSVVMSTLNKARLQIVVNHYLQTGEIGSPEFVNQKESVFVGWPRIPSILVGAPFGSVVTTVDELDRLLHPNNGKYLLNIRNLNINVALHTDSTDGDVVQCCYQAAIVRAVLCGVRGPTNTQSKTNATADELMEKMEELVNFDGHGISSSNVLELVYLSHKYTQVTFKDFLQLISKQGWIVSASLLGSDEWRCSWNVPKN